jgi:hypothetical protein
MGTDGACGLLFCAAKRSGTFPPNMPAGLRARVLRFGGFTMPAPPGFSGGAQNKTPALPGFSGGRLRKAGWVPTRPCRWSCPRRPSANFCFRALVSSLGGGGENGCCGVCEVAGYATAEGSAGFSNIQERPNTGDI